MSAPASQALVVDEIAPGVLRLTETAIAPAERANFYLLRDDGVDLLIDGGWGTAHDLAGLVQPGAPLVALSTHSHCDHVGMLHLAGERIGHAAEADVFADPTPMATQALPWIEGRAMTVDGATIVAGTFAQKPCPLTRTVRDGERLGIGGWSLEVLHLPGHSPGSLAFLVEPGGLLFTGDVVHDGAIVDDIPGADPVRLRMSHDRLAYVGFSCALPGHGGILDRDGVAAAVARHWKLRP